MQQAAEILFRAAGCVCVLHGQTPCGTLFAPSCAKLHVGFAAAGVWHGAGGVGRLFVGDGAEVRGRGGFTPGRALPRTLRTTAASASTSRDVCGLLCACLLADGTCFV